MERFCEKFIEYQLKIKTRTLRSGFEAEDLNNYK